MTQAMRDFDFRAAIEKEIAGFVAAANAGDAAGLAGFYTGDATLLPPGSPAVKGHAGIQAFWQAFLSSGASDPKLRVVEVDVVGDTAIEIGAFEANMPNPQGGAAAASGKYVVVWKRQADGGIKMAVDIFNLNS